jgi:hypothetical protein
LLTAEPLNLSNVKRLAEVDTGLTNTQRRDLASILNRIEQLFQKVEELEQLLQDAELHRGAMALMHSLIEKIEPSPREEVVLIRRSCALLLSASAGLRTPKHEQAPAAFAFAGLLFGCGDLKPPRINS